MPYKLDEYLFSLEPVCHLVSKVVNPCGCSGEDRLILSRNVKMRENDDTENGSE